MISWNIQEEFCPPLDTALIAACVADYPQETKEQRATALNELREMLSALVPDAAADQTQEDSGRDSSLSAPTEESGSMYDGNGEESSATSTNGSGGSESTPSESALDFLRASFPHIDVKKLKARLNDAETQSAELEEVDMEKLVEEILSEEFVRELEERGVKDEDELAEKMDEWHVVQRKPQKKAKGEEEVEDAVGHWRIVQKTPSQAKKKRKSKTIALSDVRQQQHPRQSAPNPHPAGDPWNQLTSIATYLESMLRPYTSTYFLSYFHKPEYLGPADALRAALAVIAQDQHLNPASGVVQPSFGRTSNEETLFTLIEFLCLEQREDFENFSDDARERLCQDADLALRATNDQPDFALDIVKLLQDLDVDGDGSREMGVYHLPASPLPSTVNMNGTNKASEINASIPAWSTSSSVVLSQPPTSPVPKPKPPPAPNQITTLNGNGWQEVKVRPKAHETHPLAAHIPAYDPYNVPRRKVRGSGNANGKGGKGDVGELKSKFGSVVRPAGVPPPSPSFRKEARLVNGAISWSQKRSINELRARRDEALRQASRYWAQGGVRNRGGEVAWHYALEAQRLQEEGRQLKLDAARELVEGKRWV